MHLRLLSLRVPQNPKTPYVSVNRSLIYQQVSAAHSERHHISELNIDYIKKFQISHGTPAADRALLEKEQELGMCSAKRRVVSRAGRSPMVPSWRHFLGKAAESTEYCDLCVVSLNIEN